MSIDNIHVNGPASLKSGTDVGLLSNINIHGVRAKTTGWTFMTQRILSNIFLSTANVILVLAGAFTFNWSLGAVTDGAKSSKNTQISLMYWISVKLVTGK